MESSETYFKNKLTIFLFGILLISSILSALFAVKNIKISPDSMTYALISQEIKSGNGIKLPIIYDINDNYVFIDGAVPYVGEPPLLPILLALLGGITPQNLLAAQIINVISHVVISIFTFMIMKKIYNISIALLSGILVSVSLPLLWNANRMLSEPLFIAATVASLYFLILSRHFDSDKFIRNLFIAGICTSAAILTRFAGVALMPLFLWVTFILVKNKSITLRHISTILTTILPFFTTGALFIYTYIISGSIHGWNPPSPERSYLDAFLVTIKMILQQFQLGERPDTLIAIFLVLFILYMIMNDNVRRELQKYVHSGLDLIIFFTISYIAVITYAMAKSQSVIEVRYVSPLVPFIFILCMIILVVVWETTRLKGFPKLSLCGLILSLCVITFGDVYKTFLNSGELFFSKDVGHYRILNSPTYKWIKENYKENVIFTSNRPYHLSFFGGYSTIRLPHKRFEKNTPIPDNMESLLPNRMSKFGSRVLALFDEVDELHEGSYLANLFRIRKDDKNFVLMHDFSDGVVYELKE
jgi:hypothetical protein